MNWFLVPRLRPKPPAGTYSDWKPQIAKNCGHQCVYCTISEGEYGGVDNFHVEHFRPKSLFLKLENDIDNLYVACAICNRFKSDEWPGEPHAKGATATFLDPGVVNYHDHLGLTRPGVHIIGKTIAGTFMTERLFLNREQLLVSRRYRITLAALRAARSHLSGELDQLGAAGAPGRALVHEIAKVSLRINELLAKASEARPYVAGATQRQIPSSRPRKRAVKR